MSYLISQVTDYLINHLVDFRDNSVFIIDEMRQKEATCGKVFSKKSSQCLRFTVSLKSD